MSLHGVAAFSRYAASLPAATLHEQWGSRVAKVGGKVFALLSLETESIAFKVSELSFEGLTALDGIGQAPYFAKRQWVSVARSAPLRDAELKAYIAASHAIIVAKLTRRLRTELGLASRSGSAARAGPPARCFAVKIGSNRAAAR